MGCTFTALINKDNRKNKSGKYSIFIRITVDRKSRYFRLDEKVEAKFWIGKENHWIKTDHPFSFELNAAIKGKIDILYKYYYRQRSFGNGVSMESLASFFNKRADPNVFNEYVVEYMRSGIRGKALGTIKKYRTFVRYLNEFNSRIAFSELGEPLFQKFAAWLQARGMKGVTVYKYFDPFKVICRQAVKDGYLEKDPFAYVTLGVKPTKGTRVYWELEEINQLKSVTIPASRPDLITTRKHWMFCFAAGFYHSDLRVLRWEYIKHHPQCVIEGYRYKNNNRYIAPIFLFPFALEILKEQEGKDPILVFPEAISDQKFNLKLKELAKLAGIKKRLMAKTARHSNVQLLAAAGIETQTLSKIAGHTKPSTINVYYELSAKDIISRVSKLDISSLEV